MAVREARSRRSNALDRLPHGLFGLLERNGDTTVSIDAGWRE
jgi:hypothetical protein